MKNTLLLLLIIGIGFCTKASGQPLDSLITLTRDAIHHNSGLQAAQALVRQADAGIKEAEARRLPQLSADVAATRGDNPVYVFGSLLTQHRFTAANFNVDELNNPSSLTNVKSSLSLGMPLFTGFQISRGIKSYRLMKEQALSGEDESRQEVRLQTSLFYLRILYDNSVLEVLNRHQLSINQELMEASKLKERGVVLGSDFYAAQAISGMFNSWKIQLESDRAANHNQLSIAVGRKLPLPTETLFGPDYSLPPEDQLVAEALKNQPKLRRLQANSQMAVLTQKNEKQTFLPQVQAFASVETNTKNFDSNPSNHSYGVAAHIPFGDVSILQRSKRAAAGVEAARLSEEAAKEQIEMEVRGIYVTLRGLYQNLPQMKETVSQTGRSLELFRPLYKTGRQSILDVLRAEEAAARAEAAYLEAMLQFHSNFLRLMAAAGQLDESSLSLVASSLGEKP